MLDNSWITEIKTAFVEYLGNIRHIRRQKKGGKISNSCFESGITLMQHHKKRHHKKLKNFAC
jgi:hypothetical protein